jgi:hypothetical protein
MALTREQEADYTVRGKKFCFTGALTIFTRDQAKALLIERGGIVHLSVKTDTDYLIYGHDTGQTKMNAARARGTNLRSEQWLLAAITANAPGLVPRKNIPDVTTVFQQPQAEVKESIEMKPKVRRVRVR